MVASALLLFPAFLFALVGFTAATPVERADLVTACKNIEQAIGKSNVFYPGSAEYEADVYHNFGSSAEVAACSVDPATPSDVGKVLLQLKAAKVPFAVKSGGHDFAQKFSSTTGVQIDLSKFNEIKLSEKEGTVTVGPGQSWDAVYTALDKYNLTCIGARQPSVGVGGFLTGGGYGWLSNQYGLGIDNVVSFQLVKTDGSVVTVTEKQEDLFFALKGAHNNFGIVTGFTIKTFKQGPVWGGTFSVATKDVPALTNEIANFAATVNDPKASMAAYYLGAVGSNSTTMLGFIFYDAPAPPAGLYDKILALDKLTFDVKQRSMLQLIQASSSSPFPRGLVEQIPVLTFPVPLLQAFEAEAIAMAETMKDSDPVWIGMLVEPFDSSLLKHAKKTSTEYPLSAWPPTREFSVTTSAVWLGWKEASQDAKIQQAARDAAGRIAATAVGLGQKEADPNFKDTSIYPNYAATWTTAKQLWGSNLPILQKIKKVHDPQDVMGLAGAIKIHPA